MSFSQAGETIERLTAELAEARRINSDLIRERDAAVIRAGIAEARLAQTLSPERNRSIADRIIMGLRDLLDAR